MLSIEMEELFAEMAEIGSAGSEVGFEFLGLRFE